MANIDPRLTSDGLGITAATLLMVAADHESVDVRCSWCQVTYCPSWRLAAPLLVKRRAECQPPAPPWLLKLACQPMPKLPPPRKARNLQPDLFDVPEPRQRK